MNNNDSQESQLIIQEYAKNPINNYKMNNPTVTQHEWNFICGDDITIYLKIKDNHIQEYSFDGNCSSITLASASLLAELIINKEINEITTRTYDTLKTHGLIVSNRRKNAAVIALLASIKAIYRYLWQNKQIDFDDLY